MRDRYGKTDSPILGALKPKPQTLKPLKRWGRTRRCLLEVLGCPKTGKAGKLGHAPFLGKKVARGSW